MPGIKPEQVEPSRKQVRGVVGWRLPHRVDSLVGSAGHRQPAQAGKDVYRRPCWVRCSCAAVDVPIPPVPADPAAVRSQSTQEVASGSDPLSDVVHAGNPLQTGGSPVSTGLRLRLNPTESGLIRTRLARDWREQALAPSPRLRTIRRAGAWRARRSGARPCRSA